MGLHSFVFAGISLAFAASTYGADAASTWSTPLLPRRLLFASAQKSLPLISPDGTRLAYLAPHQGRLNIWLKTLGKEDDRPLTDFQDRAVRWCHWQYDGRGLIFFRDDQGDEDWRLWHVGLEGAAKDLTPKGVEDIANFSLHRAAPAEALLQLRTKGSDWYLYRINLNSGKLTPVGRVPGRVWADNKLAVRIASHGNFGQQFQVQDKPDVGWRSLFSLGVDETFGDVEGFSVDNDHAFVTASFGDDTSGLWKVSLADGKRQRLAWDSGADVEEVLIDPATREPEAVSFYKDKLEWLPLSEQARADFAILRSFAKGELRVISRDAKAERWTVASVRADQPAQFFLYERHGHEAQGATVKGLFSESPDLDKAVLADMRPVSFAARDGMLLHAYLSLPPGLDPRGLPLILFPHGGPWLRDHWGFDPEVQWLCNRGYAVLQVNYRGSAGYGRKYLNAGDQEWGRKMSTDLLDGKAWAVRQGFADAARVGIYGGSYGGYAALAGLAFTPKEYRCGVDICGPSNLMTLFEGLRWYYGATIVDRRVGRTDWQKGLLQSRSPLHSARNIEAPLFIAQGKHDPRVPRRESEQMVEALKRHGKRYEYVLFDDEGHGFSKWEHQLSLNEKVEAFLAQHLGGRMESPEFGRTQGDDDEALYAKNLKVNEAAIALGKTSAYLAMADRHLAGNGVEKSPEKAFAWVLKAAEAGDVRAMVRAGQSYGAGDGVTKSAQRSLEWMTKAAKTGDHWAEGMLGAAYRWNWFAFGDPVKARQWLGTALGDKDGRAGWELARMLSLGFGGPVDEEGAFRALSQGAQIGDDWCKRELGRLARRGKAPGIDLKEARRLLKEAGPTDWWAEFYLGLMEEKGEGGRRSAGKAEELWSRHLEGEGSWSWSGTPARIAAAPGKVLLDGTLASFQHVTPIVMNGASADHTPFGPVKAPDFLWAALRMMRDDRYLYVGCDVRQGRPPVNRRQAGGELWNADSLELWISSRSGQTTRKRSTKTPFDFQFAFAPQSQGGSPTYEAVQDVRGVKVLAKPNSTGYTMVAVIPLDELDGLDWQSGSLTRFEASVAKAGADGIRYVKAFWNGKDDGAWDKPDWWGLALVE